MKRITILFIALASMMIFTACLSDGKTSVEDDQNSEITSLETELKSESESEDSYGAKGALLGEEFTLEEMLEYAIQDEYLARQEYELIINEYGHIKPFSNIIKAEVKHIEMLEEIYKEYNLLIPEDTSLSYVVVPQKLNLAYEIGVQAELDNIAMYEMFLEQDLPDDIREIFLELRDASKNHLVAFEKGPRGRGNT